MKYTIRHKIWLESDGEIFLGPGRIWLLKAIDETGSLNSAAKKLKISYKKAWKMIDGAVEVAPQPILEKSIGGKGGGGTKLTPYAKEIIKQFESLVQETDVFLNNKCQQINNE
jgi:molybdate transport system regulatory protein